ncbi:acyl-CoA thioesterase [Peribacillus butanolivorans]|uniref:acyl-CoA thioesterase n=1 Tax=Peribacillus butanolivorans TaxID=421767 RepID=UPI00207D02C5|nr:thioesterase family protein [Peribacillus butanolivorans]MCO0597258.1 acyl-CoA thioesterase [Peribacillus butanolivorans]
MNRISYIDNIKEWGSDFSFKHEIKVRFSETDMFGHLNNTVPFTYFEEARIEYFNSMGFMKDWTSDGSNEIPVVADLQCDYIQQVFFNDQLMIHVKAARVGNSSVDIHYMGTKQDGSVCLTGRGTIVQVSKTTGNPIPWPEEMKERMARTKVKHS